jgi:hypothetical protein
LRFAGDAEIAPGEELLLVEHAVDLASSTHAGQPPTPSGLTRTAGTRRGQISGCRPPLRGWAAPFRRMFDRRPAALRTRL